MIICGIDFETTGLDSSKDEVIETGLVLWDWERKAPLKIANILTKPTNPLSPEIMKITGITDSDFEFAAPKQTLIDNLEWFFNHSDYVMAHNAQFDKGFSKKLLKDEKGWLCSREDIEYDDFKHKAKNLATLAATHGFLNPFAHRAVFDVLTMFKVAQNYDINKIIERSKSPSVKVISLASFDEKEKVKAAGFYWDSAKKVWYTNIKSCDMEKANWDFKFKIEA